MVVDSQVSQKSGHMTLNYAIIGTGALGGFYGGLMARSGLDVHFLFHSDFEHVVQHGLRVDSKLGDFYLPKVQAYRDVRDMPSVDCVIVGLKSTQNHLLATLLPPLMREDTVVLVLQNGLHVEQATRDVVGEGRVAGGCCFLCSNKVGPGHIRHLDYGRIVFGPYRGLDDSESGPPSDRLQAIQQDLVNAGIDGQLTDDLTTARWRKLMWNIPFNGLSVILNASTDAIMKDPHSRNLARRVSEEVRQTACKCGSAIEPEFVDWVVDHTDEMVPYDSSMRLDFKQGRPIEVEAIYGNAMRAALRRGVETPILTSLYQQLHFLAAHRPAHQKDA
ncbi:MAG: putative 2-dehydropantoate 2-reductase [Pirellula sp.]|jgi:2-dehydropantoate 2-reductase|nr:putative 2-dehydropantoate 2-reductase [Pirellula sp.]